MKENIIQQKSFAFAIRIVELFKFLQTKRKNLSYPNKYFVPVQVSEQTSKSLSEVLDKDFLHKLTISYKEARETIYWLKLLHATHYISEKEFNSLHNDAEEICKYWAKSRLLKSCNS